MFLHVIIKGETEDREFDPPFVMIELESEESSRISLDACKFDVPRTSVSIRVWSRNMQERDVLCEDIKNALLNTSSSDGTLTISENNLFPNTSSVDVSAIKVDRLGLMRIKAVMAQ